MNEINSAHNLSFEYKNQFLSEINEILTDNEISRLEFSHMLDWSIGRVHAVMSGREDLTIFIMAKMAYVLGYKLDNPVLKKVKTYES